MGTCSRLSLPHSRASWERCCCCGRGGSTTLMLVSDGFFPGGTSVPSSHILVIRASHTGNLTARGRARDVGDHERSLPCLSARAQFLKSMHVDRLETVLKLRSGFSRSGKGARFCISNKLLAYHPHSEDQGESFNRYWPNQTPSPSPSLQRQNSARSSIILCCKPRKTSLPVSRHLWFTSQARGTQRSK